MRRALVIAACVGSALVGGLVGHARMPADLVKAPQLRPCATEDDPGPCHWDAARQGNGQGTSFDAPGPPYCMVDTDDPRHLTVAGPPDGWITVDDRPAGQLVMIGGDYAEEVQPDAGPYGGILYNVAGPGEVSVDGIVCEST